MTATPERQPFPVLAVVSTVSGILLGTVSVMAIALTITVATAYNTPCPTEDSNGCHWDGGRNHIGTTFTVVESPLIPPCDALPEGPIPEGTICGVTE